MGGFGSGQRRSSWKVSTSDCYRLDVRWLHRKGLLFPGGYFPLTWTRNGEPTGSIGLWSETDRVILRYRHHRFDEPWKEQEYPVMLEWTPCNYGGTRVWFRCPIWSCGRRVAVLYGNGMFACRQCHQLAYESQREQPYSRALSHAQAIVERLSGAWADGFPDKPKGMHWRTYSGLFREYEDAQHRSWPPWLLRQIE